MPNNDSHQHVVKTSAQWNERAVEYWVVPRGCLCIELTPKGITKLKVGEGDKTYHQLPYICNHEDLSNYYTKEEVDVLLTNLNRMAIVSTDEYDSKDDLPLNGNKLGDVRFVKSSDPDPDIYVWNGDKWITTKSDTDLSEYVTKSEFNPVKDKVDEIYPKAHTHDNKDVLDGITQKKLDEIDELGDMYVEVKGDITDLKSKSHTHSNKSILDSITPTSLWTQSDRDKFDSLHNYDDTEVKFRLLNVEEKAHTHDNKTVLDGITQEKLDEIDELAATYVIVKHDILDLKEKSHIHENKDILDGTNASYTLDQQNELHRLSRISTFIGAGPTWDGIFGYVPAPEMGQQTYFLRGDGTWAKVKSGGDKYKAGEGIYILSGEVISDKFPFEIFPKAATVTQYVIYGNADGVGNSVSGHYEIPIKISAPGYSDRTQTISIADPLYDGDYIDFQKQVFAHYRTKITSRVQIDPNYRYKTAIYSDGHIGRFDPGAYGSSPAVSLPFEIIPGATYEIYPWNTSVDRLRDFRNGMYVNLYDADMNRTRTIFQEYQGNTIIVATSNEKYMRMTLQDIRDWWDPFYFGYQVIYQLYPVETPCQLNELILYPNVINTIDVLTTNKPNEIYVEVVPPDDEDIDPDDPMSEYTGIIYNDGVLDVTQEDPTNLAELTVHFRDEVTKTLTIPSASVMEGATTSTDGTEGLVPAPLAGDENKFLRGDGTWAIPGGSVTYAAGDGITFTHPGMTDLGFDFDAFVAKITSINNGTKTVDLEHELLTLTATGDDCYTKPYTDTSVQNVYTFPIVAGHVYRLTWDSSNPSVSGRIFAFENVSETNLHWVDQSVQDYLEFTAVTSGTINFRFGVQNSEDTISYSNIHFYEMDDFDPNTTIINDDIAKGLEFDSLDKLQVKLGDRLHFDENNAIAVDSDLYYAGQGIEFGGETELPTEFIASDFIDGITSVYHGDVTKSGDRTSFTLTATGSDCYTDSYSGYDGYYITAEPNTKYMLSWSSARGTRGNIFVFEMNGTSITDIMYRANNADTNRRIFTTSSTCNKLSIRFGVGNSGDSETFSNIKFVKIVPLNNVIEAKLGNGLHFDENNAIAVDSATSQYVRVSTNDSYVLLHTKPSDWDDTWYKYYALSYDEITTEPVNWDPTRHYKYENDNYVLGSPGDTFVSTTWYDKHYNGLDPNTPVIFDSDVYYTSTLNLIQDGELFDTAFEKVNEAIEHIERLEQNVQFLHDNKVDVRETVDPERIEFYYS